MSDAFFNEDGYRKYIILGIFTVIFLIIFLFVIFRGKESYLIINESSIIKKKGLKYNQVMSLDSKIWDGKYNVYSDGELFKDVTIKYKDNSWYYFDKDYNDLDLNKVSLIYDSSLSKLKEASYDVSFYEDDDDYVLSEVLEGEDISNYKDSLIKSSFDIDNDGVVETIYTISDLGLSDSDGTSSYIFLVKNGKLFKILEKDTDESFLLQNIVDVDGDGKYELFVSKGTNDVVTFDTCIKMYSVNKNKVKCIMDCK